jgi:hypothetical protein
MFTRVNWRHQLGLWSTEGYVTSRRDPAITSRHILIPDQRVEHAGFFRDIISRNPLLVDEDGYEVDSEDDDERAQAAITAAAQFDPYADVKIESTVAPDSRASSY